MKLFRGQNMYRIGRQLWSAFCSDDVYELNDYNVLVRLTTDRWRERVNSAVMNRFSSMLLVYLQK